MILTKVLGLKESTDVIEKQGGLSRKSLASGIRVYLLHFLAGSVGVFVVGTLLSSLFSTRIASELFDGPLFGGDIVLGFLAGFILNRELRSKSAIWAWVLPAIWLIANIPDAFGSLYGSNGLGVLFGTRCRPDCLDQLLSVDPFYGSVAYSVGAWAALQWIASPRHERKIGIAWVLLIVGLYSFVVIMGVYVLTVVVVLIALLTSHPAGQLAGTVFGGPHYGGEIAVALIGGLFLGARIRPQQAKWVWVLPSISLLIYMVYAAHTNGQMGFIQYVWTHFFSGRCAKPYMDCPQETFGTCPFFSSLAFSFAAWLASRKRSAFLSSSNQI